MDALELKCGAVVYPSKIIPNSKGNILHGMKRSDPGYVEFGEVYFSTVENGAVKGWKKHLSMTMNLAVPVGRIRFYLSNEEDALIENVVLGDINYARLFVPPGIWLAFEGIGCGTNLLMNLASIEHDPSESIVRGFDL